MYNPLPATVPLLASFQIGTIGLKILMLLLDGTFFVYYRPFLNTMTNIALN